MNQLQVAELEDLGVEVTTVEEQEELKQRFQITNIESLNWAFRKVSALQSKAKEIETLAAAEKQRIDQWAVSELKPIENSLDFFKQLITEYHSKQLEVDPKAKTISTPYGKSKTRKTSAQPEKANEEDILQYVFENNLDEFVKSSVKWVDLKKTLKIVEISGEKVVVDENGQIVPGVTVKPESISYSVEV
ncbi:host-nuclease inhibitor Gam family protein [Margalitia sp. FSL K6-0131]|uniref:host-nuclease inhibitor Gam family protein n=1 Tax=Margalitia sp. FSL K6-0131 TaxID=2954604 RepID=UPI0030FC41E9